MVKAHPPFEVRQVQAAAEWGAARALLEEYATSLGVDLSLQGFSEEVADLARAYPHPGGFWLAVRAGQAVGSVALRPLGEGVAELKRLYVRPEARRGNVGRALVGVALRAARAAGMQAVRLDTLPAMRSAQALYRKLGFRPIPAYRTDTLPGAECFELALAPSPLLGRAR